MLDRTRQVLQFDSSRRNVQRLEVFTARFRAAIKKSIEGIIEAGRVLIEAKAQLEHGQFTDWLENELRFPAREAQTLMYLARDEVISNPSNYTALPVSPRTLWELTQIPKPQLRELIADGTINPAMRIEDAVALRRQGSPIHRERFVAPRLKKELASLVDVAILLGGADVVLGHIRELKEGNIPTVKAFDQSARWARQKLSKHRIRST
jgi:hypothetical protein